MGRHTLLSFVATRTVFVTGQIQRRRREREKEKESNRDNVHVVVSTVLVIYYYIYLNWQTFFRKIKQVG